MRSVVWGEKLSAQRPWRWGFDMLQVSSEICEVTYVYMYIYIYDNSCDILKSNSDVIILKVVFNNLKAYEVLVYQKGEVM